MQELSNQEAGKHNVLPLDDRFTERADARLRPSNLRGMTRFVYPPGTVRIPEPSAPNTRNVNHTIAAEIEELAVEVKARIAMAVQQPDCVQTVVPSQYWS